MKEERDYLVKVLKESGIRSRVHDSMKSLKNCNETHVGAVLRVKETFSRSGSKRIYEESGQRKQRKKLHERITILHVVIADSDEVSDVLPPDLLPDPNTPDLVFHSGKDG